MNSPINRRLLFKLISAISATGGLFDKRPGFAAQDNLDQPTDRVAAMLLGSLIGDALGGPLEFKSPDEVRDVMPGARSWPAERSLQEHDLTRLAETLELNGYERLRPDAAPYGPWRRAAPAGTLTDDSRHKIVLIRALKQMLAANRSRLRRTDLARELIEFRPLPDSEPSDELEALVDEGLREYRLASRWLLGERDLELARPVERLWAGVDNCSGQMALIPLAAVFPGQPLRTYQATYQLDFIDTPAARDLAAALNAGLAAALDPRLDAESTEIRWEACLRAIGETDPYDYNAVPFVGRPLNKWLDLAKSISDRAAGSPAIAYRLLESEGQPAFYWDAHFTLLVPLTMLRLCDFNPLAALHLTLDFGHDTDSYAQVLGAMAGAVHGKAILPLTMQTTVSKRLAEDYGESVDDWVATLADAAQTWIQAQHHDD